MDRWTRGMIVDAVRSGNHDAVEQHSRFCNMSEMDEVKQIVRDHAMPWERFEIGDRMFYDGLMLTSLGPSRLRRDDDDGYA